jgi:hypothetical protein
MPACGSTVAPGGAFVGRKLDSARAANIVLRHQHGSGGAMPTPSELRAEARRLKQAASVETDQDARRSLLAHALELVQRAKQMAHEEAKRRKDK